MTNGFIVNDGTGPLNGATGEQAEENIKQFLRDCVDETIQLDATHPSRLSRFVDENVQFDFPHWSDLPSVQMISYSKISEAGLNPLEQKRQQEGRYHFLLQYDGRQCIVAIPGLPLEQVRLLAPNASQHHSLGVPRLYIDDMSWLWEYAISRTRSALFKLREEI